MSGHKLELIRHKELNESHLYYWDWISGVNDTQFLLFEGKAWRISEDEPVEVNLAEELSKLAAMLDSQVELFETERKKK